MKYTATLKLDALTYPTGNVRGPAKPRIRQVALDLDPPIARKQTGQRLGVIKKIRKSFHDLAQ
jgi:hypothetical protein